MPLTSLHPKAVYEGTKEIKELSTKTHFEQYRFGDKMEVVARTRTSNSDSSSEHRHGPVSVDEYLEKYLEADGPTSGDDYREASSSSGPISIDAFLESASQFITYPQKERVLSMSTATESTRTESCASPPISPPISPPESPLSAVHRPIITGFYTSEPSQKSESVESLIRSIDDNENKNDPEGCRYEEIMDDASAETEVGSNCSSKRGRVVAKELSIKTKVEVGGTYTESESSSSADGESDFNGQNKAIVVPGKFVEPETEALEWTYEDHIAKKEKSAKDPEQEKFDSLEKERIGKVMKFAVLVLMLEVAAAVIAIKNHQDLVECCGNSVFSNDESVGERWNKIFFWVGIIYLPVIILIEIPTLLIAQEPLFIFNPMVGFLLAMQMLYTTDVMNAYIIFGLEFLAMLCQSRVLAYMRRSPESCLHYALNYTLAAITIFMLVRLKQQGGYCIVGNRIQSVFSEQTCNVGCIDDDSCFRCNSGDEFFVPNCFIPFY